MRLLDPGFNVDAGAVAAIRLLGDAFVVLGSSFETSRDANESNGSLDTGRGSSGIGGARLPGCPFDCCCAEAVDRSGGGAKMWGDTAL